MKSRLFALTFAILSCTALSIAVANEPITFEKHIAPIVHQKCTLCHRENQSGPFSLITFEHVRKRAATIEAVIEDNYMPPWKPINTNLEYANDRRLTKEEKKLLKTWINTGMKSGDLTKVKMPEYPDGWSLGKPDLVLKMKGKFDVPASGPDVYRSFVFEADLPEDKWVKAIELRPSARSVVHHALFFIDPTGQARQQDARDGKAGFTGMSFLRLGLGGGSESRQSVRGLGGYVPGAMPNKLPGDLAMFFPKGSDIVMQTHFHPSGKKETEQAEMAIYFADKPPTRNLRAIQTPPLFGRFAGIDVPAGEKDFEVTDKFKIPTDVEAIGVSGHAHYICREMEMTAKLPNGKKIDLLRIDDWDLDWQDQYQFAKPLQLPANTEISTRLVYDNSANNPENPHSPPRRIKWGRESTDEMGSITLQVVAKEKKNDRTLNRSIREAYLRAVSNSRNNSPSNTIADRIRKRVRDSLRDGKIIERLDRNKDGKLQKSEIPQRFRQSVLDTMDTNKDGVLDKQEIEAIQKMAKGDK